MPTSTEFSCVLFIFHNRVRKTQKKKFWRLSSYSTTTALAKSLSKISSEWPKSSGRTSRMRSYRCVFLQMWGNTQKEDVPVCKSHRRTVSLLRKCLVSQWVVNDIRSDKITEQQLTPLGNTACFWQLFCDMIVSWGFYLEQEMIDEADRDGDGEINEQEFLRIMKKTSLYWIPSSLKLLYL